MDEMKWIFLSVAMLLAILASATMREDSIKKNLVEHEYGFPHFAFLFWIFGIFENPKFVDFTHLTLTLPGVRMVEVWGRIIGPFWIRLGWRDMSFEEMEAYYWRVHARMEEKRAKMAASAGPESPDGGVPENSPDHPVT